jgi:hypothetical protein
MPFLSDPAADAPEARRRWLWFVAGSTAATAILVAIAFFLGAWAFDTRRALTHETRLQRLVDRKPRLEQVVQGLEDEGSRLVASPGSDDELRAVAALRGGRRADEAVRKGRRWSTTRVFAAGDMVYFIYFDEEGVMRDFVSVNAR